MSSQFIHINTYARNSKTTEKKNKAGVVKQSTSRSIRQITDEATRAPGACPHVADTKEPILLYGVSPSEVPKMCESYAETVKTKSGQKLRTDALVCIAGVVSIGTPDNHKWEKVKKDSIEYLKNKYGSRLKSIVEHCDENFKHFHFYVIPKDGEKLEDIHEGLKARNTSRNNNEKTGTQNRHYREAMKGFQDDYSKFVGIPNGLTRIGPARRRLTREAWRAETDEANRIAEKLQLYADKKKIAFKGYQKGKEEGLEKSKELGAIFGSFLKAISDPFTQANNQLQKEKEEKEKEIERLKKTKNTLQEELEQLKKAHIKTQKEFIRFKDFIRERDEKRTEENRLKLNDYLEKERIKEENLRNSQQATKETINTSNKKFRI